MIKELDSVVLTVDLREHGLTRGDIGPREITQARPIEVR